MKAYITLHPKVEARNRKRFADVSSKNAARIFGMASDIAISTAEPAERLDMLYRLVEEVWLLAAPSSPCTRGCSHCCHQPVALPRYEVEEIGRRIGVQPVKSPARSSAYFDGVAEHNTNGPCTFLVKGKCSIYEHRPLACRKQISLAATPDPCNVKEILHGIPYVDLMKADLLLVDIAISAGLSSMVDLREAFPNGRNKSD